MSNQLLTVTEFAKICLVTPRTIRWYQQVSLIKPAKIDKWNKYAYFKPEQALVVFKIKLLQQLNIPLKETKNKLRSRSLDSSLADLEKFVSQKQTELNFLKSLNDLLYKKNPSKLLTDETVGTFNSISRIVLHADYHKIDSYLEEVRKTAQDLGITVQGEGIIFYSDSELEYKPKSTSLEVAFKINNKLKPTLSLPTDYKLKNTPKTKVLSFKFTAPTLLHNIYLPLIYKKLDKHIFDKKIKLSGLVFETYFIDKATASRTTTICYPTS